MEGRTIARPDVIARRKSLSPHLPFNGGPDNCPARPNPVGYGDNGQPFLQWRAGQLPGQTAWGAAVGGLDQLPSMEGRTIARPDAIILYLFLDCFPPSMEGRTIARPDVAKRMPQQDRVNSFNGGPDNCPARPSRDGLLLLMRQTLQWRAGQLPGQTSAVFSFLLMAGSLQWRAGQLPGQTRC